MKRIVFIFVFVLFASIGFVVEAKSTMEQLINKEWYEFDFTSLSAKEGYYIKFTGTQRMIVGQDQEGNAKARVQRYYLSAEPVKKFDDTKVGKVRDGEYIVFPPRNEKSAALCLKINSLSDETLETEDITAPNHKKVHYITSINTTEGKEEENVLKGKVISTLDLLADKQWHEIDEKTGKKLRTELTFDRLNCVTRCIMGENPKRTIPDWQMREFYFSDNIETEFDHSKIGDRINGIYLVVKEKNKDGAWYVANYDISTLSANRLVLNCVYPKGVPTQVFVSKQGLKEAIGKRQKPQQWQLTENVWYRLDTATLKRGRFTERFDKNKVTRSYPVIVDGVRSTRTTESVYYMSNEADTVFDHTQVGKSLEGDYIVVNEQSGKEERKAVSYRIEFLQDSNMIVSCDVDGGEVIIAYERDRSEAERANAETARQDSIRGKTTLDYLSGRQWRFSKRPHARMSERQRWYFTDSLWVTVNFNYDVFSREWVTKLNLQEYYISKVAHHNFNRRELKKKNEDGRFVNYFRIIRFIKRLQPPFAMDRPDKRPLPGHPGLKTKVSAIRTFAFEIRFLSEDILVYDTVPIAFDPHGTGGGYAGPIFQYTLLND